MERLIRVLVVDDSAYVRKVMKQMLLRSSKIDVVGAARDGAEALEMVERLKPDVVTCDLIMAGMDGVSFVREQMARRPVPILVVSIANDSGELALAALDAGAIDFLQKPTALATEKVLEIGTELVEKIQAVARAPMARMQTQAPVVARPPHRIEARAGLVDVVVLGISTGGPQALRALVPRFPADFPVPMALVLHMPVGYTEMYASKLNEISSLSVKEAHEGDAVEPGSLLIAPAGKHLSFVKDDTGDVFAHLHRRPFDTPHRPAVDVLFRSAAETFHGRTLGVVMTGMGYDGRQGSAWIKAQGGIIFTEAEETCIVYGMPGAVVEAGLSDRSVPLDRMAEAILEVV